VTISTFLSTSYSLVTKSVRVRGNVSVSKSASLFVDPCPSPYPCPWSCSWNISMFLSADMCPWPCRCLRTRLSVCVLFVSMDTVLSWWCYHPWTRVRVRVHGHVLWWRHCSLLWWRHCKEPIKKGSKSNSAKVCKRPEMNGILQFSSFFQVQCTDHQFNCPVCS